MTKRKLILNYTIWINSAPKTFVVSRFKELASVNEMQLLCFIFGVQWWLLRSN